jgi:hypothetical protein
MTPAPEEQSSEAGGDPKSVRSCDDCGAPEAVQFGER